MSSCFAHNEAIIVAYEISYSSTAQLKHTCEKQTNVIRQQKEMIQEDMKEKQKMKYNDARIKIPW